MSRHSFKKLYLIDSAITVVLIFHPLLLQPSTLHLLRQSPHHYSCPWVMQISSLATLFSVLYSTSPWLFCDYQFVHLNPLTSSSIPPQLLSIGQSSKCTWYLWFCLHSSCLFSLFFRCSCWWICICCHFIVHSFDLLFLK